MLGFVSAHTPCNTISNLDLWRSYNASWSELELLSASTLSNNRRKEYTVTVDAIEKQLRSRNKVSLAFDAWTSTNKIPIMSVIAHYMHRTCALREIPPAFDEVGSPLFTYFEISLRITGQGSTYGSTDSRTFEGSSWSLKADQWPFTWNFNRWQFPKLLDVS